MVSKLFGSMLNKILNKRCCLPDPFPKCHDSGALAKTMVYKDLRYRNLPRLALLRSTVPEGSVWNRLTNFLVSRPRDVSYRVFSSGDLNTHQLVNQRMCPTTAAEFPFKETVLRIRAVYPESDLFPSRIPDTGSVSKNLSISTQKNGF